MTARREKKKERSTVSPGKQQRSRSKQCSLQHLQQHPLLVQFFSRPDFLQKEDEEALLQHICDNQIDLFYERAASLIKSSRNVSQLYIYLLSQMELRRIDNQHLQNHVCWRLFDLAQIGWLRIPDPEILSYCRQYANDPELLRELAQLHPRPWLAQYLRLVPIERKIEFSLRHIEEDVRSYISSITELHKTKKITDDEFDHIHQRLKNALQIFKGGGVIGSLISQDLQHLLSFDVVSPQIAILRIEEMKLLDKK